MSSDCIKLCSLNKTHLQALHIGQYSKCKSSASSALPAFLKGGKAEPYSHEFKSPSTATHSLCAVHPFTRRLCGSLTLSRCPGLYLVMT